MKTKLAKKERDFEIIRDIDAQNQVDLIKTALDPLDRQYANDTITSADYNRTEYNEPLPPQVDPNVLKIISEIVHNTNAFVNEPDPNLLQIMLQPQPQPSVAPPIIKKPTLQDVLTEPNEEDLLSQMKAVQEEVKQEEIVLLPPEKTGIVPIDEKNYEDYLDTLEVIRPDLFIDEEDNYVEPSTMNALVPVGTMDVVPSDPMDAIAHPYVGTILPPTDSSLPAILPTSAYSVPTKGRTFAPMDEDEDDDIDFSVELADAPDLTVSLPIEVNTDNITLTGDGDVELIDPDNMQVEDKALVPMGEETIALPEIENRQPVKSSKLILKRKNDNEPEMANIKMIKNDTDIRLRDVVPYSENKAILPYSGIKHPIERKMEKDIKNAKKQARLVKSRAIDLTSLDHVEMKPRIKGEWDQLPTVDIVTMNRFPWIDFNHILDTTDIDRREEVIFDLLQNNMPYSEDDRYFIYHDVETNVFSIEEDPLMEETDDLTTQILLLNAKLKVRDVSPKERTRIIETRNLKLKELRKTFEANELAGSLSTEGYLNLN